VERKSNVEVLKKKYEKKTVYDSYFYIYLFTDKNNIGIAAWNFGRIKMLLYFYTGLLKMFFMWPPRANNYS